MFLMKFLEVIGFIFFIISLIYGVIILVTEVSISASIVFLLIGLIGLSGFALEKGWIFK